MKVFELDLIESQDLGPGARELVFSGFTEACRPGQFVMVKVPGFYLPRPFSISYSSHNRLHLMVVAVGQGSQALIDLPLGNPLQVWGPLGTSFPKLDEAPSSVLVGGGFGVAPLAFALERLKEKGGDPSLHTLIYGARSRAGLRNLRRMEALGCQLVCCTDDGSYGEKRRPHEVLPDIPGFECLLSCGPMAMMKAAAAFCNERKIPSFISLETHMACGFGVCNGCTLENINGQMVKICNSGPVVSGALHAQV